MKVKKIILPIVLSLVIALSGFTLFGCGKKEAKEESFKLYSSIVQTMKDDNKIFKSDKIHGLETDFYIKDIGYKTANNNQLQGYQYYVSLLGAGLNFIDDYYVKLDTKQGVVKNVAINDAAYAMRNSFNVVKSEHEKLVLAQNTSNLNFNIYNAHFYNYRISVSNFINKVYDCAFSLANYLDKYLGLSANVGTNKMSQENFDFYLDYQYLRIYNDYKTLYLISAKGADLNVNFLNDNYFTEFNKLVSKDKLSIAELENINDIVLIFNNLAGTRGDATAAMKNFSIYNYVEFYGKDLVAYNKDSEHAYAYASKISEYFSNENSVLKNLTRKLDRKFTQETAKLYSIVMKTISEDSSLFENGPTYSLQTKFYIKDIGYKTADGKIQGYRHYRAILAAGLEYINDYYGKLEVVSGNVESLTDTVKVMFDQYRKVKIEHDKLVTANKKSKLSANEYNKYFDSYKLAIAELIDDVYDCALTLNDYLKNELNLGSNFGSSDMTEQDINFYLDYNFIKIYNDFKVLYIDSINGEDLEADVLNKEILSSFNLLTSADRVSSLAIDKANNIALGLAVVEVNSGEFREAVKEFSIYKFITQYNQDIDAYQKDDENAATNYKKITDYFVGEDSILNVVIKSLNNLILA